MTELLSKTDSKCLIAKFKYKKSIFCCIRIKDISEDIWTMWRPLKHALSVCKIKILQFIHLNQQLELTKRKIIQIVIQQTKNFPLSMTANQFIRKNKHQFSQQNINQQHNFKNFFDQFKIPLVVTSYLWKYCFLLIKQSQLFEVVGRIFNKQTGAFSYLIKYKYFEHHKYLFWVNKSVLRKHQATKLIQNFDVQNPFTKKFLVSQRYFMYSKMLINKFCSQFKNKYLTILGKAKIKERIFYLAIRGSQNLQRAKWLMILCFEKSWKASEINDKVLQIEHNLDISPFIDRQIIKQIILKEADLNSLKQNKKQKNKYLQAQVIEKVIDEKVQMFMEKFQKLKTQVQTYLEGVQIFDQFTDSVSISALRQKMSTIQKRMSSNKVKTKVQSEIESQILSKKEVFLKSQYQSDSCQDENSDSEIQENEQYFDLSEKVKIQNSMVEIQYVAEQQSQEDSEDFYEKIKKQCKEEHTESLFLENERKKSHKFSRSSFRRKTCKKIEKKLKKETNLQTTFYDGQAQVKKEQFNTSSAQPESETLKTKDQSEVEKKELHQTAKIRKLQKFLNSTNCSDVVYRVHFNDGKIVFCTKSELIEKEGISCQMIQNMESNE